MKNVVITILVTILVLGIIFFGFTSTGRQVWNRYMYGLEKADEVSYESRKAVEDTARAYIASYNADVEIYHAYKGSTETKMADYAEAARMRAIRTATTYNEYILKNTFVWKGNVPSDIYMNLETNIP